jgi:hypothetical protein
MKIKNMKLVRENLNFEREYDSFKKLNIGKKAKADEIEWGWYPGSEYREEFIDLIYYPKKENSDLYIKISKLIDMNGKSSFIAINNIKESYTFTPFQSETLEEAIIKEKNYLDNLYYDDKIMKDR